VVIGRCASLRFGQWVVKHDSLSEPKTIQVESDMIHRQRIFFWQRPHLPAKRSRPCWRHDPRWSCTARLRRGRVWV